MELLIVRHGIAVEAGTPGFRDDERPLTEEGERKWAEAAKGLAVLLPAPDLVLTSPLIRARRTAEIAAAAWGRVKPTVVPVLAGGGADKILAALKEHREHARVALFGHEPDVSELTARLLGAPQAERLAFKKGGVALFEVSPQSPSDGRLLWFVPQKVLRHVRD